jgi:hypothetical protein
VAWSKNLIGERLSDRINLAHHPKNNVIRLEAVACIRLRLATDKPDEGVAGGVEPRSELWVLLDANLSKHNRRVGAKGLHLCSSGGKCWSNRVGLLVKIDEDVQLVDVDNLSEILGRDEGCTV